MSIEGSLGICIGVKQGRVGEVRLSSSRRVDACRVLLGRSVEDALGAVPLLFSVCAQAQTVAALEAIENALGVMVDENQRSYRELLVVVEAVDNHARQIAFEWTSRLGAPPAVTEAQALRRAGDDVLAATGAPRRGAILGGVSVQPASDLVELAEALGACITTLAGPALPQSIDAFSAWMLGGAPAQRALCVLSEQGLSELGRSELPLLPELEREWFVRQMVGSPSFANRPEWQGAPAETGALARRAADPLLGALLARYGNGLVTRFVARVSELQALGLRVAELARTLGGSAGSPAQSREGGQGASVVHTARGQLAHVVRVDLGRLTDYRIVAPTESELPPTGAADPRTSRRERPGHPAPRGASGRVPGSLCGLRARGHGGRACMSSLWPKAFSVSSKTMRKGTASPASAVFTSRSALSLT